MQGGSVAGFTFISSAETLVSWSMGYDEKSRGAAIGASLFRHASMEAARSPILLEVDSQRET